MEQLFVCVSCRCVDMLDLAESEAKRFSVPYQQFRCTYCLTKQWHGQFPYQLYDPAKDRVVNPPIPPSCS